MHSLIPTILLALLSVLISALPSPTNTNTTLCGTFKKDFNTTGDRPFYATQTCETTPIAEGYMFLDFLDSCTCNYWAAVCDGRPQYLLDTVFHDAIILNIMGVYCCEVKG
ncbi:hypothetical protein BU26DRAFT_557477 [Trematosphaeria pertusa]|uniref:Uncharacterized protein n=1 Tax=Trematosphaeria pertusa TaxID=390896 RepID=A0A6A6J262_9PLEO|nr:uncharacterized protein BU26DRAFT_557477 [Trematosphaeria pertusa]KAF2256000.1 hypothetical protein BU26DRAFT_557477 [Trematosphaeria pertusa]